MPHGRGVFHFADGGVYDGNLFCSIMHGRGTMKLASGDIYEGNKKLDSRLIFADFCVLYNINTIIIHIILTVLIIRHSNLLFSVNLYSFLCIVYFITYLQSVDFYR